MSATAQDFAADGGGGDGVRCSRVTWEGCSVLLDINDGDRMIFSRLSSAATFKIGNNNYSLHHLIGCPFGSSFQVGVGADGPCLSVLIFYCKGATGEEIIEALIADSATFENKTSFIQEKYRLKKRKKYAPKILLRRPFTRSICEAYFKKYPHKIGFLRMGTLSLLLSLANVTANSNTLVVDMLSGLLTGSVAERLGGYGYVCSAYMGSTPYSLDIVRMFNFSNEICRRIFWVAVINMATGSSNNLLGLLVDWGISGGTWRPNSLPNDSKISTLKDDFADVLAKNLSRYQDKRQ